jgi:hypothetical protein
MPDLKRWHVVMAASIERYEAWWSADPCPGRKCTSVLGFFLSRLAGRKVTIADRPTARGLLRPVWRGVAALEVRE